MTTGTGARSSTVGNGTTLVYAATFRALSTTEVGVALINNTTGVVTVQTINTNYTVALNATTGAPTITFVVAPTSTQTVLIYPLAIVQQPTVLSPSSALYGSSIEATLDAITARLQSIEDRLNQTVRAPQADPALAALGDAGARRGTFLTFTTETGAPQLRPLSLLGLS